MLRWIVKLGVVFSVILSPRVNQVYQEFLARDALLCQDSGKRLRGF